MMLGFYRIPLYFVSGLSALLAYLSSCRKPSEVFVFLRHSSVYRDERVYLPLPYLRRTLLIAYNEQPEKTIAEIVFIAAERPLQLRAARTVALEIAMRELEACKTLSDIARISHRFAEIFPQEVKLIDPQWVTTFARLNDASRDAMRCMTPIGRQARSRALDDMVSNLRKVHQDIAFRNEQLNRRLNQVVERWLARALYEQEYLKYVVQDRGKIDNPYKPGQVLKPNDSLFVGRRDLAQQLEQILNRGSSRPTLLLYGERRIGKSSTLLQLPYLLGSTYVPVFCNLQDPGIYAKTTTFLGTLARNIAIAMNSRGMSIEQLSYKALQESGQVNDSLVYETFDHWLIQIEAILDREDRILLLAFDEFEKLEEAGEIGDLNLRPLFDWYRKIIQYHSRMALVFSGIHRFSEMGSKTGMNWSSSFVNVQTLRVSFLKPDEARHLITLPWANDSDKSFFDDEVINQIIYETGCHPFLIQAICSELIDTLNTEKREYAEPRDVKQAVNQILEDWDSYFSDLWIRTDSDQRACLITLRIHGIMDLQDIQLQSGLGEEKAHHALQALLMRDLILTHKKDSYQIAVPIFSKWMEHNYHA
jgi:hypothetical protein